MSGPAWVGNRAAPDADWVADGHSMFPKSVVPAWAVGVLAEPFLVYPDNGTADDGIDGTPSQTITNERLERVWIDSVNAATVPGRFTVTYKYPHRRRTRSAPRRRLRQGVPDRPTAIFTGERWLCFDRTDGQVAWVNPAIATLLHGVVAFDSLHQDPDPLKAIVAYRGQVAVGLFMPMRSTLGDPREGVAMVLAAPEPETPGQRDRLVAALQSPPIQGTE